LLAVATNLLQYKQCKSHMRQEQDLQDKVTRIIHLSSLNLNSCVSREARHHDEHGTQNSHVFGLSGITDGLNSKKDEKKNYI
jgi:hypothetical protein